MNSNAFALVFVLLAAPPPRPISPPPVVAADVAVPVSLQSLAPLIDSVKGAVVNVDVRVRRSTPAQNEGGLSEEQLERYFGLHSASPKNQLQQGMGSGFVVDPRGLIVTNNHVVEGAVIIRVRLEDGRAFDAEVMGRDPLTDLALLRVKNNPDALPAVRMGDSSASKVGDFVIAIGNPFGLASSVSLGIISALNRNIHAGPYDQFLQTDAAINPGNSGGPLFNVKGEVIGINTAIVGNASGLGFAVPSNVAKTLLPQLEKAGSVTRGWLGIGIQDLNPSLSKALNVPIQDGAVILAVGDNTPAKRAGIAEDDVVYSIDGVKVISGDGLSRSVAQAAPNSDVKLALYRAGKPYEVTVKLGARPDLEDTGVKKAKDAAPAPGAQPRIGLGFQDIDARLAQAVELPTFGALVVDIVPASAAERAGLRRGMVIVEAGRQKIRNRDDLAKVLAQSKPGTTLLLRVMLPGRGKAVHGLELP